MTDHHNGGQLQFGPDGNLWIGTGDGGCGGDLRTTPRTAGSLLGKLLRINPRAAARLPRYRPDNPFARPARARTTIYA